MAKIINHKTPWEERRPALIAELAALVLQWDRKQIAHVSDSIHHVYVHFYRGNRELGDLSFATALHALVEDVYDWPDGGRENQRTHERGALDIREADLLTLQSH